MDDADILHLHSWHISSRSEGEPFPVFEMLAAALNLAQLHHESTKGMYAIRCVYVCFRSAITLQ